jgi:hypothetical protein
MGNIEVACDIVEFAMFGFRFSNWGFRITLGFACN